MNIVLADSNNLIRIGLRSILNSNKDISIVAEANSAAVLLDILSSFKVDLVIIDYTSMNFNIDVIVELKKSSFSKVNRLEIHNKINSLLIREFDIGLHSLQIKII